MVTTPRAIFSTRQVPPANILCRQASAPIVGLSAQLVVGI